MLKEKSLWILSRKCYLNLKNGSGTMIEVNIVGQLGNQMFEYACARQLQKKYGGEIVLNTYEMRKETPNFKLSILDYKLSENVKIISDKPLSSANANNYLVKIMRQYFPNLYFNFMAKRGTFVWKSARKYKELPELNEQLSKHIVLNGYWQCDKYFNDVVDTIREDFTPKYPLKAENEQLLEKIKSTESVCVTIRRGDFMNEKNKDTFYICDDDYFNKALSKIKELCPDCTFFGFSDDVEWIKKNVNFPGEVYFESGNDPVWEKLRLMSACKHFVLSNSSFSWWAQYLSDNNNKIVVAPDIWYKTGDPKKTALYQDGWNLIHIGD